MVIASNNINKVREIAGILAKDGFEPTSLLDFPEIPSAEETGSTFLENAQIKARHYHQYLHQTVLADDSGLVVKALNGAPGVYSSRYAHPRATDHENLMHLLDNMRTIPDTERRAFFVCQMVFFDGKRFLNAEGRVDGFITRKPRGRNGFGYDPVFLVPAFDRTFAEMDPDIKNRISHRFRALNILRGILAEYRGK